MNDLDICKRIAEIEGLEFYLLESGEDTYPLIKVWSDSVLVGKDIPKRFFTAHDYNVVTNDALCFQLMVKYKVNIIMNDMYCCKINEGETPFACISNGAQVNRKKTEELTTITTTIKIRKNANYNKAICLAIIEAHKEQS